MTEATKTIDQVEVTDSDLKGLVTPDIDIANPQSEQPAEETEEQKAEESTDSSQEESTETPDDDEVQSKSEESDETQESESTDEEDEPVTYEVSGETYTQEQIEDALVALDNKKEWQTSNTQKAQEVAVNRKAVEPLVQLIERVKSNEGVADILKEVLSDELDEDAVKLLDNSLAFDTEKVANPFKDELTSVQSELGQLKAEKVLNDAKSQLVKDHKLTVRQADKVAQEAFDIFEKSGRLLTLEEAYKQSELYSEKIKKQALKEAENKVDKKKPKPPKLAKKSRGASGNEKPEKTTDYKDIDISGYNLIQ